MADSLVDQANRAAIDDVKQRTPNSFTVGGRFDGKRIVGGVSYDRTLANGWGLTAYARAWWDDLPVSVGMKAVAINRPQGEIGVEAVKKF